VSRPMTNDPEYHRGPLPAGVTTPSERQRVRTLIEQTRSVLRAADECNKKPVPKRPGWDA